MIGQLNVNAPAATAIQDSGNIVVAVGPGWTQIFAAMLGTSLHWNILMVSAVPGANTIEFATGLPGFEVNLLHMSVPPQASDFGWTLMRSPLQIIRGTRIAMRATAIATTIETHMYYNG